MKLKINFVKILLISTALLLTNSVHANVGKIVYGYGNNYALDTDGNRRDLKKGDEIREGDTLVTGRGRMHVRLIDGGFVSVYPHSEYRIDKFKFSGKKIDDGVPAVSNKKVKEAVESKKDKGFFSLLKGAARQVTGLLGRTYNENFKFRTSVATIGIRGTGFFARLCQADCFDADGHPLQDGLHVKNNTGIITVKTNAGEVSLAQGQSAFAASSEDQPQQTVQPPIARNHVIPDIELFDFNEKILDVDQEVEVGVLTPVDPPVDPPVTPSTIVLTNLEYVTSIDTSVPAPFGGIDSTNGTDTIQQNGNEINRFTGTGVFVDLGPLVFDKGAGTLQESGSDALLGVVWNRWSTGYTLTEDASDITTSGPVSGKDIHLIGTNNLTSTLPGAAGGIVNYTSVGGTSPTIEGFAGSQVGTQTVTAEIDYGSNIVNNFQVDVVFSNATISANLLTIENLTGVSGNTVSLIGSCSGAGCNSATAVGFDGSASINLVGANAEGIYGVFNMTNQENAVSGSYVATDGSLVAPQL